MHTIQDDILDCSQQLNQLEFGLSVCLFVSLSTHLCNPHLPTNVCHLKSWQYFVCICLLPSFGRSPMSDGDPIVPQWLLMSQEMFWPYTRATTRPSFVTWRVCIHILAFQRTPFYTKLLTKQSPKKLWCNICINHVTHVVNRHVVKYLLHY